MNRKTRTMLRKGTAILSAMLILSGCKDANNSSEKVVQENIQADSITELTVMLYDRGNIPTNQGVINDNRWTKYINEEVEKLGLHVKFIPVSRSDEGQKVPVMMTSGTAADIMMSYDIGTVQRFHKDGGTWELSEYIEECGPNLKAYIGDDVLVKGKDEEGNQFAIPARRSTTARTNAFIRMDWLNKLEMAVPTTPDELYDVLWAFKYENPDGLQPNEVVGLQQFNISKEMLANCFWQETDERSVFINSECDSAGALAAGDPGYRDYMRFRNKLYNDGLMDSEYFTDLGYGQKANELFVKGKLGYYEYHVNGNVDVMRGGLLQTLKQSIPEAEMVSIPPLKNIHDGKIYNSQDSNSAAFLFIPKTAKDPAACIKYLDWLATKEGGFTIWHGIEGEHFEMQGQVPAVLDAQKNAVEKDWIRDDLFLVGNGGYFITEADYIACKVLENAEYSNYIQNNFDNATMGEAISSYGYMSPTQAKEAANLKKVNNEYSVKVSTCKTDEFDAMFDEWAAALEKYNIQQIKEERASYYDNFFSKQ